MNRIFFISAVLLGGMVFLLYPGAGRAAADVGLSQSVTYNSVQGQLTYAVTWNTFVNNPHVVVADTLPDGTTFASASPGSVLSGKTVTWDLGAKAAGDSGQLSVTVSVDSAQALNLGADKLVSFSAGTASASTTASSSNPALALGASDNQGVALGSGGQITLGFALPVVNDSGADVKIFGSGQVNVEVSNDLSSWTDLGAVNAGEGVDLGQNSYINYVRITNNSSGSASLDAVMALHKFPFACSLVNSVSSGQVTDRKVYDFVNGCSYGYSYGSGILNLPTTSPVSVSAGTAPSPTQGSSGGGSAPSSSTPPEMGGGAPEVLGATLPATGLPFWLMYFLLLPVAFLAGSETKVFLKSLKNRK